MAETPRPGGKIGPGRLKRGVDAVPGALEWYVGKRDRPKSGWFALVPSGGAPVARVDRTIFCRALLIGVIAAAVGLSACGRKGALEPPPGAAVKTDQAGVKPDSGPQKPDKPFFLDRLL